MAKNVLVFIEAASPEPGFELLTPGRELAASLGGELLAAVLGGDADTAAKEAAALGADTVIAAASPELAVYSTDGYAFALTEIIKKYRPDTVLISATVNGRDLAPRVAARLGTGLTADCVAVSVLENEIVGWTLPAYGGNLMATITCPEKRPQMGTIRPGVFQRPEPLESGRGRIIGENIVLPENCVRTGILEAAAGRLKEAQLAKAEVIVCGGMGAGSEGFALIRELAELLGGAVGATRPAVDAGFADSSCLVGQTGQYVRPKLYIACGVSGASQHTAGIRDSGLIVAINRDERAPIFACADYKVVGDMFQVVPALISELKRLKNI